MSRVRSRGKVRGSLLCYELWLMVSYEKMLQVVMNYTEAFIQEIPERIIAFSGHLDHCHCFVASTPVSAWPVDRPVDIFITYV